MAKPTFIESPATVQSQYAASPRMLALIKGFEEKLSPNDDITLFFDKIFNIETAEGIGLDIWGIILGIGRFIDAVDGEAFGFDHSLLKPFNQAPFFSNGVTDSFYLTDQAYRDLLMMKAMANISSADLYTLNRLLQQLFHGERAYVVEVGVMQLLFVFEFSPKPWQIALFNRPGLLTRGAGVGIDWIAIPRSATFGFRGSGLQPFNHGTFASTFFPTHVK